MNLYNTSLVILTINCGEFYQGIRSEKIGRLNAVNINITLLVIVTVNWGEFLKHTLSNCDDEL